MIIMDSHHTPWIFHSSFDQNLGTSKITRISPKHWWKHCLATWSFENPFAAKITSCTELPGPHPSQGGAVLPLRRHTDVAGGIAVLTQGLAVTSVTKVSHGLETAWKLRCKNHPVPQTLVVQWPSIFRCQRSRQEMVLLDC